MNQSSILSRFPTVSIFVATLLVLIPERAAAADTVVYEGQTGPGSGKHIIFLAGDEEYRSEESLPQMAQILAGRHGFKCTVLFSLDAKDGTINPNASASLGDAAALDHADAIFMMLRFRQYPDAVMQHFVKAYLAGKPIIALRTSTHAFKYGNPTNSAFAKYSHNSKQWPGGFGRQVLGETWVSHLGTNHKEATRGVIEPAAKHEALLRGVGTIFADTGCYLVNPQPDSTILLRAEILAGPAPDSPLHPTKNTPQQPLAWYRVHKNEAGNTNKVFCTTMGSATDLRDESLRRLLVNSVYWGFNLEVPAKADVQLVGDFQPSEYSFGGFRKGVKPADLALPATTK
jgi:hypothetical protein